MKKMILAAAFTVLASSSSFAAGDPNCTPAIQNWVNGSKTTCLYATTNPASTRNTFSSGISTPPTKPEHECHPKGGDGEGGGEGEGEGGGESAAKG